MCVIEVTELGHFWAKVWMKVSRMDDEEKKMLKFPVCSFTEIALKRLFSESVNRSNHYYLESNATGS